jgi:2-oxoglutarate ferredoxin oxidoreductase subunit delta
MKKIADERLKRIRTGYVWANPRLCKACWKCVGICPEQVIGKVGFLWHKHIIFRDSDSCTGCKRCVKACPYGVFSDISQER